VAEVDRLSGEEGEPTLQTTEEINGLAAARASDDNKEPMPNGFIESAGVKVVDAVFFCQQI
jgi:hypothetical protein